MENSRRTNIVYNNYYGKKYMQGNVFVLGKYFQQIDQKNVCFKYINL